MALLKQNFPGKFFQFCTVLASPSPSPLLSTTSSFTLSTRQENRIRSTARFNRLLCFVSSKHCTPLRTTQQNTIQKKKRTGTCDAHTSHQQQPTGIMSDNILNTTPHLNVYLKHNIAAIPFRLLFLSFRNISVSLLISLQITNDER